MVAASVTVNLPHRKLAVGCVIASEIDPAAAADFLESPIATLLEERQADTLPRKFEEIRRACRDMLRTGKYKPTGRGKPSSEYLLRAVRAGEFPRISALVDICNLVSLQWMIPISVADLDRMATPAIQFRLGQAGESYVFNQAGQDLALQDLVVGCATAEDGSTVPMLSPIKDSMAAKTTPQTCRVGAFLYFPTALFRQGQMYDVCRSYADHLAQLGTAVSADIIVVEPPNTDL